MADLQGSVWRKVIAREELEDFGRSYQVISTHLAAGETVVHVFAENQPAPDFQGVEPDLKDVYFTTLKGAEAALVA